MITRSDNGGMSIWGKAQAKADELIGRAEEVYGEAHGDAAAQVAGEARRLEGEAEEAADRAPHEPASPGDEGASSRH